VSVECTSEVCSARSINEFEGVCAASPARKVCHFRTSSWVIGEFTDDAEVLRPTPPNPPFTRGGKVKGFLVAMALSLITGFSTSLRADDQSAPTFERDIKPLFIKNCTVCHRASKRDDREISGGLALDSYEAVLAGTTREKVIVPGRSADSELARRLADADENRRMPLQDKPLAGPQQDLVRRWIDQGAPRGVPVPTAVATGSRTRSRPRPLRHVRSLDVVLPTEVKLAPGTWNAAAGGALSVSLPVGPLPAVSALALRGDSRLLAVGTYGQVMLWDLNDGHPAGALVDIPGPVHTVAFSRDGRRLAVGAGLPARSGVVRVFAVPDGTLIHDFEGHEDVVYSLAFRPDGGQLASASFDQTVRLWNLGLSRPDGVFRGHSDFVYSVAYSPDGRTLWTSGKDRTIKRINVRTLKEERTYSGHDDDVFAVAVHPDGKRFVSAGNEPQLRWWNVGGDKPSARRSGHSGPVQQLAFSGDGRRLISVGGDRSVRLWDGMTGESIRQLTGQAEWQYAAAISDDGLVAAAGGWDGLVRLWDAASGRLLVTLVQPPADALFSPGATPSPPDWLAITPGGQVAGSPDLLRVAQWRAGSVTLPAQAARAACDCPVAVARAVRGETVPAVSFPTTKRK
jgi:Planctomycete cytochrome C/WD domain, G-beta repeat